MQFNPIIHEIIRIQETRTSGSIILLEEGTNISTLDSIHLFELHLFLICFQIQYFLTGTKLATLGMANQNLWHSEDRDSQFSNEAAVLISSQRYYFCQHQGRYDSLVEILEYSNGPDVHFWQFLMQF